MPTVWDNSNVDRLQTLFTRRDRAQKVVDGVRREIEPLVLPDAAKLLVAIASDAMTAVRSRNERPDVDNACAALQQAIAALEAIGPGLDG